MMKHVKRIRNPILFSLTFYFVAFFSLSFLVFIPMLESEYQILMSHAVAVLFWSCLAFGCVFCFRTSLSVQRVLRSLGKETRIRKNKLPGIVSFSKDFRHLILYITFIAGLILMITDMINSWVPSYIMFPVISVTMFTFTVHCIVDGSNYKIYRLMKEGLNND